MTSLRETGQTAGVATRRIRRVRVLDAVLPEFDHYRVLHWPYSASVDAVVGWGMKPTAAHARRAARDRGLPYIALEDGFLRSWGPAAAGYQPHSLVVDRQGIYYDATRPSDLETTIHSGRFSDTERERARHCMDLLRTHRLSKYNHAPDLPLPSSEYSRRVLVVDQTHGDSSIRAGRADTDTFHGMLVEAIERNPDAEIVVKIHPDVIAGTKSGHLLEAAQHPRCRIIDHDRNPWTLFDAVDTVHVVTSQLGFEALLAGKSVVCHGMPFFAGWGLTEDRLEEPRRNVTRTLEEVFAAAYLRYCRYANPYTGEATTIERTIALLADQKRHQERLAGDWITAGLPQWKRIFARDFLGERARVRHARSLPAAEKKRHAPERVLAWSTVAPGAEQAKSAHAGTDLARMEDGFIRSVGLGADLEPPLSMVVDRSGIYYDGTRPSDLEEILNHTDFTDELIARARELRQQLVAQGLSKYNLNGRDLPTLPDDRRILLVPGQVESDASIRYGARAIRTNRDLLEAVRNGNPDAFILYKPHPDVVAGGRRGLLGRHAAPLYDLDVADADIATLLDRVDEVHTMTSLTGFEGLLRGCRVATHGLPFYAGWGLTEDTVHCPRRQRTLDLDELVAGSLLLYPIYRDPASRQICDAETALTLLRHRRAQCRRLPWRARAYRQYRRLLVGRR